MKGSSTSVAVWKLIWEVVSCKRDAKGVLLQETLLPLAVSQGRVYTYGLGELRFLLVGD